MAKRLFTVITYSYDVEVLENIAEKLMKIGVPAAHIIKTDSWYRWKSNVVNATEYKLDILCLKEQVSEVVALIKNRHNYEVTAITWYEIHTDNDTFSWVSNEGLPKP